MAEQTPNLGLTKPARSELYDVAVTNANMDKIDEELGGVTSQLADTMTDVGDVSVFSATGTSISEKANNEFSSRAINVEWYSSLVVNNDWTEALRKAAADAISKNSPLYCPRKLTMNIYDTVNLTGVRFLELNGTINSYVDNKPCLIIGNDSRNALPVKIYVNRVSKATTLNPGDIGIRVVGVKNGDIKVDWCYYLQLYANAADPAQASISYSNFYPGLVDVLEMYGESGLSWITECNFFGGRYKEIRIGNTGAGYPHNNHTFYKPCVEAGKIHVIKGIRNVFLDLRSEGGTQVIFETGGERNTIIDNYAPNWGTIGGAFTVIDNGRENTVTNRLQMNLTRVPLVTVSPKSKIFNNTSEFKLTDSNALIPGLKYFKGTAWAYVFREILKTDNVKRYGFYSKTKGGVGVFRPYITCYDKDMNQLFETDPNSPLIVSYGMTYSTESGRYTFSTNIDKCEFLVANGNVKFIQFELRFGSGISTTLISELQIYAEAKREFASELEQVKGQFKSDLYSNSITSGRGQLGTLIAHSGGVRTCVKNIEVSTTVNALTGSTQLSVTSTTGIEVNDIVGIVTSTEDTQWSKVSAVGTDTITLTNALTADINSGASVVINKWV